MKMRLILIGMIFLVVLSFVLAYGSDSGGPSGADDAGTDASTDSDTGDADVGGITDDEMEDVLNEMEDDEEVAIGESVSFSEGKMLGSNLVVKATTGEVKTYLDGSIPKDSIENVISIEQKLSKEDTLKGRAKGNMELSHGPLSCVLEENKFAGLTFDKEKTGTTKDSVLVESKTEKGYSSFYSNPKGGVIFETGKSIIDLEDLSNIKYTGENTVISWNEEKVSNSLLDSVNSVKESKTYVNVNPSPEIIDKAKEERYVGDLQGKANVKAVIEKYGEKTWGDHKQETRAIVTFDDQGESIIGFVESHVLANARNIKESGELMEQKIEKLGLPDEEEKNLRENFRKAYDKTTAKFTFGIEKKEDTQIKFRDEKGNKIEGVKDVVLQGDKVKNVGKAFDLSF